MSIYGIPSFYLMKKTSILVKLLCKLHPKGLQMMTVSNWKKLNHQAEKLRNA